MKTLEAPTVDDTLSVLLDFAKSADLTEVVWEKEGRRVAFKRGAEIKKVVAAAPPPPPVVEGPKVTVVTSPMVGTFWRATSKDRPPMVVDGDVVSVGQRVAQVEAMKVSKDVTASAAGRVVKVHVENGASVEYGQKLFDIEEV